MVMRDCAIIAADIYSTVTQAQYCNYSHLAM